MNVVEHMLIVDDVDKAMAEFSKNDFDIVFDFINTDIGCLVIYDEVILEHRIEIVEVVEGIFNKYGYSVQSCWYKEDMGNGLPSFSLEIKVVDKNG